MKHTEPIKTDFIKKCIRVDKDMLKTAGMRPVKLTLWTKMKLALKSRRKPCIPIDHVNVLYVLISVTFITLIATSCFFTAELGKTRKDLNSKISAIDIPEQTVTLPDIVVTLPALPEPTSPAIETLPLPAGSDGSFKAFERVWKIDDKTSEQYRLKQLYWIDEQAFCRFFDLYVVALPQFYAQQIGQIFRIQFEFRTIMAIVGDVKDDKDTIDRMYCRENGSIVEFLIDDRVMDPAIYTGGDASALGMQGKVVSITEVKQDGKSF